MLKNSSYTFLMVTLATVSLYTWSVAHFNAFITVFGLDYAVLERSFYQTLYYGFLHSFGNLLIFVVYMVVLFFLVYVVTSILPEVINLLNKKVVGDSKPESSPARLAKRMMLSGGACVCVLVLFVVSLSYMEKDGEKLGFEKLASFTSTDVTKVPIINVKIDGENKELFFIVCGSVNCAGMEGKSDLIYYFPLVSGFSYKFNRPLLGGT